MPNDCSPSRASPDNFSRTRRKAGLDLAAVIDLGFYGSNCCVGWVSTGSGSDRVVQRSVTRSLPLPVLTPLGFVTLPPVLLLRLRNRLRVSRDLRPSCSA